MQLRKLLARCRFLVSARFKSFPQLTRQTAADFGRDVNRLEQMRHDGLELFHRARVERLVRSSSAFDPWRALHGLAANISRDEADKKQNYHPITDVPYSLHMFVS